MDKLDCMLLELLQENARVSVSELSKRLALSRPSVAERLTRLQEKGVIEEFSARVSLSAVNRDTILFIQLSSMKVAPDKLEAMIAADEDIIECHRVTGQIDYVIKAAVDGMEGMRLLINRLIPYGTLNTTVVIGSPVPYRHVSPILKNMG